MIDEALVVFIKNPIKGKVKTRLGEQIGHDKAFELYRNLLTYTRKIAEQYKGERYLFYSNAINYGDNWPEETFHKRLQIGTDLGQRMLHAFDLVFEAGYSKAIIIGSDCPEIQPQHLKTAFEQLDQNDFVIGPANDGGYYLLGMKRLRPSLFLHKTWSADTVFKEAIAEMEKLKARYFILPELIDIDTAEDLHIIERKLKSAING